MVEWHPKADRMSARRGQCPDALVCSPRAPARALDTATGLLLRRRAVRPACPDRRIASRKKGRRDAPPYVSPSPSTRQGCQKVAGGRSGRKGADHRIDARIAMHLGEVPETALPVWKLVSLPAQKAVVWHPSGMQTDRRPRTGGRSPLPPWNDHRLPSTNPAGLGRGTGSTIRALTRFIRMVSSCHEREGNPARDRGAAG